MQISIGKLAATGVAAATAMAVALPATAAMTTLKVSSCLARNHDQVEAYFATFHEPLNKMSEQTGLKLNYIGGPEVTPRQKQAAAVKRGLIDIINCPSAYYQTLVPEARVAGVNNVGPAELRKNGGFELLQEGWKKGLNARILGWGHWEASTFFIYTKFEPKTDTVTGIDLTGRKMRSTGLYNAFLKKMKATPVNISPGDVYAALERGVVDGLAWPEGSIAKYGWERFLKYKITPNFFHSTTMTIINLKKYNSLTQVQRGGGPTVTYVPGPGRAMRSRFARRGRAGRAGPSRDGSCRTRGWLHVTRQPQRNPRPGHQDQDQDTVADQERKRRLRDLEQGRALGRDPHHDVEQ